MSMQILDRLVARLITNDLVRERFDRGQLAKDLDDLGAPQEIRETLEALSAPTWDAFVRLAYRALLRLEEALEMPGVPSVLEGLQPVRVIDEQVA